MDPYAMQHWLAWIVVTVLLLVGAWMKMGSYLFYLGLAALLALVEAICRVRLSIQIASFVMVSAIFALCSWVISARSRRRDAGGDKPPSSY